MRKTGALHPVHSPESVDNLVNTRERGADEAGIHRVGPAATRFSVSEEQDSTGRGLKPQPKAG